MALHLSFKLKSAPNAENAWLMPIDGSKTIQTLKQAFKNDMGLNYIPSLWKGSTELLNQWTIVQHLADNDVVEYEDPNQGENKAGDGGQKRGFALFRDLLENQAIAVQQHILQKAVSLYGVQVAALSERDGQIAKMFYDKAKRYPSTATRTELQNLHSVKVDGPFAPATRAELFWAFKNDTKPYVFKIPQTIEDADRELQIWNLVKEGATENYLVGPIEVISIREDQKGILSPAFATSLDRVPLPLTQAKIVEIGQRTKISLDHLHNKGVYHADVKSSNIFLDTDGHEYLGDYGSCVIDGKTPHEVSLATHWPEDVDYQTTTMTKALDYHLLAVTLLDLAGVITLATTTTPLTRAELRARVEALGSGAALKTFLQSLL